MQPDSGSHQQHYDELDWPDFVEFREWLLSRCRPDYINSTG